MTSDKTQPMSDEEQALAQRWSLQPSRPPAQIPGYVLHRLLGTGAYGQVWMGTDENTGRSVAIKFYAHRGGLDWSLLSREVEKLAFLSSDRYVVQILDVGWNADPPYCVMEYVEKGSLADWLDSGADVSIAEAERLVRQIAIGLMHAHAKGILHCDLKPANVLLDQDRQPRLADFGQARLSYEQTPSLGTLFYMAPEQADLQAVPDVRWDVYALGAIMFRMLTGHPPYYTSEAAETLQKTTGLEERLTKYRELLHASPHLHLRKAIPGIDRELATILHRCLALNPHHRYASVQAVLYDLEERASRRARRPLVWLGLLGPLLVLLLGGIFAVDWMDTIMNDSRDEIVRRALEGNRFAARLAAGQVEDDLARRFELVEDEAGQPELSKLVSNVVYSERWQDRLKQIASLPEGRPKLEALEKEYRDAIAETPDSPPAELEKWLVKLGKAPRFSHSNGQLSIASWLVCDARGVCLGRWPQSDTIGHNYAWRAYFNGGPKDLSPDWRPAKPGDVKIITKPSLSPVFLSQATGRWIVGLSCPIRQSKDTLGVLTMTFMVGQIIDLPEADFQIPVLVNKTAQQHPGIILEHPLYEKDHHVAGQYTDPQFRLSPEDYPDTPERRENYRDPLANAEDGEEFAGRWLAEMVPVRLHSQNTGWVVIVQEAYEDVIGKPFQRTRRELFWLGMRSLAVGVAVSAFVWFVLIRQVVKRQRLQQRRFEILGGTSASSTTGTWTSGAGARSTEEPPP